MWNNKNDKNIYIVMIILFIFTLIVSVFLRLQIKSSNDNISKFKTEILTKNQTCNSISGNNPYDKRLENIERKYIDVLASKDTINFWITILSILLTVAFGYQIYQKQKFEEEARSELKNAKDEINKSKEVARNELNNVRDFTDKIHDQFYNIDKILEEKIKIKFNDLQNRLEEEGKKEKDKINIEAGKQRQISQYFNDGLKYYNEKKYGNALFAINKAIELGDNSSEVYNNKGLILGELGKYDEALIALNKSIELNNGNAYSYNNKGLILLKQGKYDEALITLNEAIKLDNNKFATFINHKSVVLLKQGKYDEALATLNEAIKLDNNDCYIYYNFSCAFSLKKDLINSIINLEKTFDLGFFNDNEELEKFYNDTDFDNIRGTEEFKAFVKKLEEKYPKNK